MGDVEKVSLLLLVTDELSVHDGSPNQSEGHAKYDVENKMLTCNWAGVL